MIHHESGRDIVIEALLAVLDRLDRGVADVRAPVDRVLDMAGAA